MRSQNQTNAINALSFEVASEAIATLPTTERRLIGGTEIASVLHPEHGPVFYVVSAMGESAMLLPFCTPSVDVS